MVSLEERLKAAGSLKSLMENYRFNSEDGYVEIGIYFDLLKTVSRISNKKARKIMKIF